MAGPLSAGEGDPPGLGGLGRGGKDAWGAAIGLAVGVRCGPCTLMVRKSGCAHPHVAFQPRRTPAAGSSEAPALAPALAPAAAGSGGSTARENHWDSLAFSRDRSCESTPLRIRSHPRASPNIGREPRGALPKRRAVPALGQIQVLACLFAIPALWRMHACLGSSGDPASGSPVAAAGEPPTSLLMLLLALTAVVLVLAGDSLRQWLRLRHLPAPPAPSLLWGHAPCFATTAAPLHVARWAAAVGGGGVFRIRFLHKWAVIITDPRLARAALQGGRTYVPKSTRMYRPLQAASFGSPTILTSGDGPYWRAVRAAWMRCFTSTNLKQVLPHVHQLCGRVIEQQRAAARASPDGWAATNLCQLTDRVTLDVIGRVAFGRSFGAVEGGRDGYLQLASAMLALTHQEMVHPAVRLLRRLLRDGDKEALASEWDAANTAEVQAALRDPPGEHTIAGQLLRVVDPVTGSPLTLKQLKSEMAIACLAGFETTSSALCWVLGSLAAHPAAMQRLEQELSDAGLLATTQDPSPPLLAWQQLGRLRYLQAAVREGLRLFSPAANGTFRLCEAAEVQLGEGLVLPKGTPVGVPLFALGHSPAIYGADVEAFVPERWLAAGAGGSVRGCAAGADGGGGGRQQLHDPWSFSIGPRDCAGQALARMELQVVAVALVGRFRLELAPEVGGWQGLLSRRVYRTTLQVGGGLPVRLRPRA